MSDYDFVVIGSGIGGLAGAVTAARQGMRTAVLEKSALIGGVTALSFGELWLAGNHLEEAANIPDSIEDGFGYLDRLGMGFNDPALTRALCERAPEALRFFGEVGVTWRLIPNFPDYYWPQVPGSRPGGRYVEVGPFPASELGKWRDRVRVARPPTHYLTHAEMIEQGGIIARSGWDQELLGRRREADIRCLGPGLAAAFTRTALDAGIDLLPSTPAIGLIRKAGRVIGVEAVVDGRPTVISARSGVLIAAGGYDWNATFKREYDLAPDFVSTVPAEVEGDPIRLAGAIGARLARVPVTHRLGYAVPGESESGRQLWRLGGIELGLPHSMLVDRSGHRFADESFYPTVGYAVQAIDAARLELPHYPCWAVLDCQQRERYGFGPIRKDQELPAGFAHMAGSISELAQAAGIDSLGLAAELERFNRFAEIGIDEDFHRGERPWSNLMNGDSHHKPNPNLGPINEPPFFAVPLRLVGTGLGSLGLAADGAGRVLGYDGQPLAGLYVTGTSMAMLDCGAGYQSGVANTRGMVFGRLAALDASAAI